MLIHIARDESRDGDFGGLSASLFGALLIALACSPTLMAQGLDSESAIDTIIGSEVTTGQEAAADDRERIEAAIANAVDAAAEVRRSFSLDRVEILFLPDIEEQENGLGALLEEHATEITALRESIQGSAMFFHAINSRSVMLDDIVALEFDDENGVTIFVKGENPGR